VSENLVDDGRGDDGCGEDTGKEGYRQGAEESPRAGDPIEKDRLSHSMGTGVPCP